jgi:hypothetical protein
VQHGGVFGMLLRHRLRAYATVAADAIEFVRSNSFFLHPADANDGASRKVFRFVGVLLSQFEKHAVLRLCCERRAAAHDEAEKPAGSESHKDNAKRDESGTGPSAAIITHPGYLPA